MAAEARSNAMAFVGHCDLDGSPDSLQVMVSGTHAYVAHPISGGFSVVDISDPADPQVVHREFAPVGTRSLHLQLVGDILICANEATIAVVREMGAAPPGRTPPEFSAGVRVYDVSMPEVPKEVGFTAIPGYGIHRLFWTGGDVATASVRRPHTADYVLACLDMSDPLRPMVTGYWQPPEFMTVDRATTTLGLHHAIVGADGRLYSSWRDGGMHVIRAAVRTSIDPGLALDWTAPASLWDGAMTHTTLPLPSRGLVVVADEAMTESCADGLGGVCILEMPVAGEVPTVRGRAPTPTEADYCAEPGRFGPHNLHENRPGSFVSDSLIFCTYQNAGLRMYDITDASLPVETGYFVPSAAPRVLDRRPGTSSVPRTASADVFVTVDGLAYLTDINGGLTVVSIGGS